MLAQSYENAKLLIPMAGFYIASLSGGSSDASDSDVCSEQFDRVETLLEKILDRTSKLIDKVEKFYSWQKQNAMINRAEKASILNSTNYVSFIVDKINLNEYISNNSAPREELCVKEELTNISEIDEQTVIKYLLEVMLRHNIITEEEYHTVLYKYS